MLIHLYLSKLPPLPLAGGADPPPHPQAAFAGDTDQPFSLATGEGGANPPSLQLAAVAGGADSHIFH